MKVLTARDITADSRALPRTVVRIVAILAFATATALAAQVKVFIPGNIVPITLQTAIVLLAGLRLGSRDGALSQALYIAGGALGLPFFAGTVGLAALFGPTGGYLFGFVLAAWVIGHLSQRYLSGANASFWRIWLVTFVASLVIFVPGVFQLKHFMILTWQEAVVMGVVPFFVGDLAKVTLVATTHSLSKRYFL